MKNRFKFLSLIMCLFMIMQVVLPCFDVTYAVISDSNTILIACGVTIKNNTTLKIKTICMLSGHQSIQASFRNFELCEGTTVNSLYCCRQPL